MTECPVCGNIRPEFCGNPRRCPYLSERPENTTSVIGIVGALVGSIILVITLLLLWGGNP